MELTLIPWRAFIEALKKQKPATQEIWLRRWLFTDEGVIIATPEKYSAPSQSRSPAIAVAR